MRKLITTFFILLFCFPANSADLFTSVKSSLSETIDDGLQIQLIDASISSHYILIQTNATTESEYAFLSLSREFTHQGFQYSYISNTYFHQLMIKLPKEAVDGALEQLLEHLSTTKLSSMDLIVLGSINQQRLLGIINRQFNTKKLIFEAATSDANPQSNLTMLSPLETVQGLDTVQGNQQPSSWMVALSAALINCSYRNDSGVSFYYQQQQFSCNNYSPNQSLTDKEVANLKDRLYSDIQLSIASPEGFLAYIGSFKSDRRLELSQSFYNTLPSLSIDSILEYHYKKILNVQLESETTKSSLSNVSVYNLPPDYRVKSYFAPDNSKVVRFDLAIDSSYACIQLNCASLAALPYIKYSSSEDMHLFSMVYPAEHETTVISELNKVLFIPLSTSSRIAQEHVQVTLKGGYLQEAYDESFKLMAKLSLVNVSLNKPNFNINQRETLNFHISKEHSSKVTIELSAVPGGEHWEESELYYYILASEIQELDSDTRVNKANTLVSFLLSSNIFLKVNSSPVYVDFGFKAPSEVEDLLEALMEVIGKLPKEISRDEFVKYKKGIITNLSLLNGDNEATLHISQLYDLDAPHQRLIQRIQNLSYEQFKAYLTQKLGFKTITITTNQELEEVFHKTLNKIVGDS